jgi:uncharacterized membrane protein YfhO
VEDPKALPLARLNPVGGGMRRGKIIVRSADRVVIDTPSSAAGRLVLADPAYPGWKVTVDGHAAKSVVSRGIFRAVDLPAGAHHVVWTFEPTRLRIGAMISLVALFALLGVAAIPWIRRRRAAAPTAPRV